MKRGAHGGQFSMPAAAIPIWKRGLPEASEGMRWCPGYKKSPHQASHAAFAIRQSRCNGCIAENSKDRRLARKTYQEKKGKKTPRARLGAKGVTAATTPAAKKWGWV